MRRIILSSLVIAAMTADANAQKPAAAAAGPLVVSKANPRYFTIASGNAGVRRAVYLTGSHIWNNLHDGMGPGSACAEAPERFDYPAYLTFLKERGHNFIRLWRWEQFRFTSRGRQLPPLHGAAAMAARRYAERMKLIDMVPRGDLTSTGYALAHPGTEYLVLQPSETNDAFEVRLAAGSYSVEWYNVKTRETKQAGKVRVDRDGSVRFTSPFAVPGPAVLYLSKP